MPGRLFLTRPLSEVASALGLSPDAAPDDPPRRNIQPGQEVITVTHGPAFRKMRWGLIPVGRTNARGRPVMETIVNARSETVFAKSAFQGVGRCVVPADGWYEWTGKKGRKTAWEIRAKDGAILWFAAICDPWTAPGGQEIWQTATVTCPAQCRSSEGARPNGRPPFSGGHPHMARRDRRAGRGDPEDGA